MKRNRLIVGVLASAAIGTAIVLAPTADAGTIPTCPISSPNAGTGVSPGPTQPAEVGPAYVPGDAGRSQLAGVGGNCLQGPPPPPPPGMFSRLGLAS
jgi:hypothetical protein